MLKKLIILIFSFFLFTFNANAGDDGELVFNDKIESKVIFKDLNGRIKKISYPDKAPLTIAIEVFKNHITNTEMNDSDVKLGHYVVKTIEEIDKKLKNINSLK